MQQLQQRQGTPVMGSQIITSHEEEQEQEQEPVVLTVLVVPNHDERRVTWDEQVIDNENMGRKSSKVCCIYHKPKAFGESSSEESSSSSSEDDSDSDYEGPSRRNPSHDHPESNGSGNEPCARHARKQRKEMRKRKPSPNAYERMPHYQKKSESTSKPADNAA